MEIPEKVSYECEFCKTRYDNREDVIAISGQFEGRSDMPYEFHFCNISCLDLEFGTLVEPDKNTDDEYYFILEEELDKRKNGK